MPSPLDLACDELGDALNAIRDAEAKFYELFLNTELFVVTDADPAGTPKEVRRITEPGESWSTPLVEEDGNFYIMLFDSKQRAANWAQREVQVVGTLGVHILNNMQFDDKTYIMLNEGTEHWKEFTPEEIQWIKDNTEDE